MQMKFLTVAILAALVLSAAASDVVTGTDATFDAVVKSHDFVLVEFYAPWCGHCKKLAPEWEAAATQLKGQAVLVGLDATVEKEAAQKYEIKGFPTIKVWREGALAGDYEGGRTADAIVKYVKSQSGPAVIAFKSADELAKLQTENKVLVTGFFAQESGAAYEAFQTTAKQLRAVHTFAATSVSTLFDGTEAPSIVVYKHFDDKREVFTGDVNDASAIKKFIGEAGIKLVDEIGPDNYKQYVDRGIPMVWLFVKPGDETSEAAKKALEEVAPIGKGKVSCVYLDGTKYGQMGQRMGLSGNVFPAIAIDHEGQHFAFSEKDDITVDALTAWLKKYLANELEATLRSEEIPAEPIVSGVTTIVGKTFDDLVVKSDQDVFIEFYAPWCGHCKSLAPIYDKLGAALEKEPIRIAKIDATANDFNQKLFPVQGFPTLFFVPKDTHTPITFSGDRSYEGMLSFIKKHATGTVNADSSAVKDDEL